MAKFITLTQNVVSKEKLFKRREQYYYVDRITMDITCPLCGECVEDTKNVIHYRLNIDGEYYYIPSFAAVKYNKVWFDNEKDMRTQIRRDNEQPTDFVKTYKSVTGRVLDNTYLADRNRMKEIMSINFSNYGVVNTKGLISTRDALDIEAGRTRGSVVDDGIEDILYQGLHVSFAEETTTYCGEADNITLTPIITGIKDRYTYLWSTGETTETIQVTVEAGEQETYTIQVTDDTGCIRTASITIIVEHYGSFDMSFDCSFDIGCLTC